MSPLSFTAKCRALPRLSTTTTASKSPGKKRPPLSVSPSGKPECPLHCAKTIINKINIDALNVNWTIEPEFILEGPSIFVYDVDMFIAVFTIQYIDHSYVISRQFFVCDFYWSIGRVYIYAMQSISTSESPGTPPFATAPGEPVRGWL